MVDRGRALRRLSRESRRHALVLGLAGAAVALVLVAAGGDAASVEACRQGDDRHPGFGDTRLLARDHSPLFEHDLGVTQPR